MEAMAAMFAVAGPAAGAGAGAAGAGSIFSAGNLIGGALAIGSAVSQISAGRQQAAQLEGQARFEDFNAQQEILKGKAAVIEELEVLNDTLAANAVAGYAAGLTGSGSVGQASFDAIEDANFRLDLTRSNAEIAAGQRRGAAASLRSDAGAAKREGVGGAIGTVGGFVERVVRRG